MTSRTPEPRNHALPARRYGNANNATWVDLELTLGGERQEPCPALRVVRDALGLLVNAAYSRLANVCQDSLAFLRAERRAGFSVAGSVPGGNGEACRCEDAESDQYAERRNEIHPHPDLDSDESGGCDAAPRLFSPPASSSRTSIRNFAADARPTAQSLIAQRQV